jgi:cytoskeletal protein CcmA (bactofilin family)
MFASKGKTTVIAEGLRIVGSVSADGAVQVNGQIDGDLNCTSITVSPKALINGAIKARSVVINGKVEGPISGEDVVLKPHAFVAGDIQAQSLSIERGAHFEGRSLRPDATNLRQLETPASNGHAELIKPAVFKKEDEPKTNVARA